MPTFCVCRHATVAMVTSSSFLRLKLEQTENSTKPTSTCCCRLFSGNIHIDHCSTDVRTDQNFSCECSTLKFDEFFLFSLMPNTRQLTKASQWLTLELNAIVMCWHVRCFFLFKIEAQVTPGWNIAGYLEMGVPALSWPVFLDLAGKSLYIGFAYIFPATPESLYTGSARLRDTGCAPKRRKSDQSGAGRMRQ